MHAVMHDQPVGPGLAPRVQRVGAGPGRGEHPVAQAAGDVAGRGGLRGRRDGAAGARAGARLSASRRRRAAARAAGVSWSAAARVVISRRSCGAVWPSVAATSASAVASGRSAVSGASAAAVAEKVAFGAVHVVARNAGVAVGEGGDDAGAVGPAQKMRAPGVGRTGGEGRVEPVGARMVGDQQVDQTLEFRGGIERRAFGWRRVVDKAGRQIRQPEDAEEHVADQVARVELAAFIGQEDQPVAVERLFPGRDAGGVVEPTEAGVEHLGERAGLASGLDGLGPGGGDHVVLTAQVEAEVEVKEGVSAAQKAAIWAGSAAEISSEDMKTRGSAKAATAGAQSGGATKCQPRRPFRKAGCGA